MKSEDRTTNYQLPTTLAKLRVAIVCDWLTGIGGAERVVLELHHMFPEAPIFTSQYAPKDIVRFAPDGINPFQNATIKTSWLQRLPKGLKKFLPVFRAWHFGRLDLSTYDLVISSSGAEAKAVRTGPDTAHIWYCHAPTHYYWSRYDAYMQHPGFGLLNPLARLGLKLLVGPMRTWDYQAAQRPDYILANSSHTESEVKKYYGREATVVHPPVETDRFKSKDDDKTERFGFVVAGRQTPYKRIDLAVAACSQLDLPLTVIGNGPDHVKLTAMAGPSVRFLTNIGDQDMAHHFQIAEGFIFPNLDDFGIVAVEAMSAGTPVIAYKAGGALDYVVHGKTGAFFEPQTVEGLVEGLTTFRSLSLDSKAITRQAQKFSVAAFSHNMQKVLEKYVQNSA